MLCIALVVVMHVHMKPFFGTIGIKHNIDFTVGIVVTTLISQLFFRINIFSQAIK